MEIFLISSIIVAIIGYAIFDSYRKKYKEVRANILDPKSIAENNETIRSFACNTKAYLSVVTWSEMQDVHYGLQGRKRVYFQTSFISSTSIDAINQANEFIRGFGDNRIEFKVEIKESEPL